jgi:predicted transcriptional regulator
MERKYMGMGMISQTCLADLRKNRSHFDIMAIMLENSRHETGTYSLVKRTNISFAQFKKYLITLETIGFLDVCEQEGRRCYKASEKGIAYLKQYYTLQKMLTLR